MLRGSTRNRSPQLSAGLRTAICRARRRPSLARSRRCARTTRSGANGSCFSSDYLPALTLRDVELVTEQIIEITRRGIVTSDGVEHLADVIIWGTGFRGTEFLAPLQITGIEGRDLHRQWSGGARAYYGMTVPHFPTC